MSSGRQSGLFEYISVGNNQSVGSYGIKVRSKPIFFRHIFTWTRQVLVQQIPS